MKLRQLKSYPFPISKPADVSAVSGMRQPCSNLGILRIDLSLNGEMDRQFRIAANVVARKGRTRLCPQPAVGKGASTSNPAAASTRGPLERVNVVSLARGGVAPAPRLLGRSPYRIRRERVRSGRAASGRVLLGVSHHESHSARKVMGDHGWEGTAFT